MSIRIVRLGTPRRPNEGLRIGAVRRPPRGVPKTEFASQNWYDVWLPDVAPSAELVKVGQAASTDKEWEVFAKKYRKELSSPQQSRLLDLLAALSRDTNMSIGCYCEDASRCHRSVLREILKSKGADLITD